MLNSDEMMKMFHLMEDKGVILSIDMIEGDLQVGEMEEIISECPGLKISHRSFRHGYKTGLEEADNACPP